MRALLGADARTSLAAPLAGISNWESMQACLDSGTTLRQQSLLDSYTG